VILSALALFIVCVSLGCGSGGGAIGSQSATLAPSIVAQPANQSTPMGLPATFNVGVNGTPLTYQWMKNGVSIPGAISSSAYRGHYTKRQKSYASDLLRSAVDVLLPKCHE
jgi:hypothetical protein